MFILYLMEHDRLSFRGVIKQGAEVNNLRNPSSQIIAVRDIQQRFFIQHHDSIDKVRCLSFQILRKPKVLDAKISLRKFLGATVGVVCFLGHRGLVFDSP